MFSARTSGPGMVGAVSGTLLIAEVKPKSPWGWVNPTSTSALAARAGQCGDWVAAHTDPRWGGSMSMLEDMRVVALDAGKPLLAKGIHDPDTTDFDALFAVADYVLCVGRSVPDLPPGQLSRLLFEPRFLQDVVGSHERLVWNTRNLQTGRQRGAKVYGGPAEQIRKVRERMAPGTWLCQASGVRTYRDVVPGVDAVLVGTELMRFTLGWKPRGGVYGAG